MEDEKKKKRNKKKKNKPNKTTTATEEEDGAAVILDQNGLNDDEHVFKDAKDQNGNVDLDRHRANGAETSMIAEAEKQQWLQREAALEETIKKLQSENASCLQKEVNLEDAIKQLRNVNDSCVQKEAIFEGMIKQLKSQNDSCMQKEAGLEMKIVQLQGEKDLWLQEKAGLAEKLDQLLDEKISLGLEVGRLEGKIKHLESEKDSWTQTESTTKETIVKMNVDITRLRMKVVELEESRNSLLKENGQLMESISSLRLQLQNVEASISSANTSEELRKRENEDLNSQIEASCALVGKLITENAELVQRVNELCIKLERQSAAAGLSLAVGSDLVVGNNELANVAVPPFHSSKNNSSSGHKLGSLEGEPAATLPYSSEPDSGEIVQIPLDDNEVRDLELQAVESDETDAVALSDAPLIGAPFRFISFVAKYVSGADLVDKNTLNTVS